MSIWKRYLKGKKESDNSNNTSKNSENAVNKSHIAFESGRQHLVSDLAIIDHSRGNLGSVPCLKYFENAIGVESEQYLLASIQDAGNIPGVWQHLKTRRLQCWGGLPPSSSNGIVSYANGDTSLPGWLNELCRAIADTGLFGSHKNVPNHVLINEYQPAEGIMHHTDGPIYADRVVIISLGSSAVMTFRRRVATAEIGAQTEEDIPPSDSLPREFSVVLRPRSVLFFSEEVYSHYMHGIEAVTGRLPPSASTPPPCLLTGGEDGVKDGDQGEDKDSGEWGGVRTSLTIRHMYRHFLTSDEAETSPTSNLHEEHLVASAFTTS